MNNCLQSKGQTVKKGGRIILIALTSPQTWLVVGICIFLQIFYHAWFQPGFLLTAVSAGTGLFLIFIWLAIFTRSDFFRRKYNRIPDETSIRELKKILDSCHVSFRKPAIKCIELAQKVRQEFDSAGFQGHIDSLMQNLHEMAANNSELLKRSEKFGTEQQKKTMTELLYKQAGYMENSYTALKKFSGNLTLFDLSMKDQKEINLEIESINQALQEAIKETQDE